MFVGPPSSTPSIDDPPPASVETVAGDVERETDRAARHRESETKIVKTETETDKD